MVDRDKVLKGLEQCKAGGSCDGCPYSIIFSSSCIFTLHADILDLLKEQENVNIALVDQCDRVRQLVKELADKPQIVRCKDCKWYDPFPMCGLLGTSDIREDFFCADGKEKDNGKEEG